MKSVYFAMDDKRKAIKIGVSVDVGQRLTLLSNEVGNSMTLISTRPGDERLERAIHARFAEHRIRGEWFTAHQSIIDEALNPSIETYCPEGKRTAGDVLRDARVELGLSRSDVVRKCLAIGYAMSERQLQQAEEATVPNAGISMAVMDALELGPMAEADYKMAVRAHTRGAR